MDVYNKAKTKKLDTYDLEKGYLKEDTLTIHLDEVQAVEEQGHEEIIAEYPNGGKDVRYVIDVEGVAYQPAQDIEQAIYVYIPYTKAELTAIVNQKRIAELKQLLRDSDYKAIKYAEGCYTEDEYKETKELRQSYRDEINKLEAEL
jgi:hypothetical protein